MSKITGIEVSQEQGRVNWLRAKSNTSFVYLVASQGTSGVDPNLEKNWKGAGDVDLPRGLIHVFDPRDIKDWKEQLALFQGLVEKHPCELPPVLDLQMDNGLRKVEMDNIGAKFCKRFAEGAGQELIIRTNAAFFDKKLPLTDWAKHRWLWVVDLTGGKKPTLPKEWSKRKPPWVFWNFSAGENSLGPAYGLESRSARLSHYFGIVARFNKMFGVMVREVDIPSEDESVVPVHDQPLVLRASGDNLAIREAPDAKAKQVGELMDGDRVGVMELSADGDVWVKVAEGKWMAWKLDGKQRLV